MIDSLKFAKKVKNLRQFSDSITFVVLPNYTLRDINIGLKIINKFNFRNISFETTLSNLQAHYYFKKFNIKYLVLKLDNYSLSLSREDISNIRSNIKQNFKLHICIQGWRDLDTLNKLIFFTELLDCKDIIISIQDERNLYSPFVLNSVPIIYNYFKNNKLNIQLQNISSIYFQNIVPLTNIARVGIEPNNTCNLFCSFCRTGRGDRKPLPMMSFAKFREIVGQFSEIPRRVELFGRGEPFNNKEIFKMIRYLKERGCHCVAISTNGHFLTKDNIRNLIESRLDKLLFLG